MEIWKPIQGYEGQYEISNLGRVKSVARVLPHSKFGTWRIRERILKPRKTGRRKIYLGACLHSGKGVQNHIKIHRLVATHFIPNPENKPQVNHIDGNQLNNAVDNLEWVTALENARHAWAHGLCKPINDAQARAVVNLDTGERFDMIASAADAYGVSRRAIWQVLGMPNRTSAGCHWDYANEHKEREAYG